MSMINPLARAKGHGSAKEGVHHWYAQRASALLLIVLTAWLFYAIASLAGAGYEEVRTFMGSPVNVSFLAVLLLSMLYHAVLGLQVVIEDYIHSAPMEIFLHFITRAAALLAAAFGLVQLIRLALGN